MCCMDTLLKIKLFGVFLLLLVGFPQKAKAHLVIDTTRIHPINEVTIVGRSRHLETRSTNPLHILTNQQFDQLNVLQVSDAVKFFPGVNVRDYGGIGGLKTVSVRSLGASHTAVSYNGVTITDVQTGQIDIGRFSLDNVQFISLHNGQSDQIFQPARSFASASMLSIKTIDPVFEAHQNWKASVNIKGGSFGLVNPAFLLQHRINQRTAITASGEWMYAHGQYPYLLEYSYRTDGITSMEKRQNTQVQNLRFETSLHSRWSATESFRLKTYWYSAERGLPGATIFYNTHHFSSQSLSDQTAFVQAFYQQQFTPDWTLQLNAKYNYAKLNYLDTTYLNQIGRMESTYRQNEVYVSASTLFQPTEHWHFSWSTDAFTNTMRAAFETEEVTNTFANPQRTSLLSVLAAKYTHEQLTATASMLSTTVLEKVQRGSTAPNHQRWSPYVGVTYQPFTQHNLRLRTFYKHIFRLPSFNDLYYTRIGNTNLRPETTHQWNVGLTYSVQPSRIIPHVSIIADLYRNRVIDKIVAMPTKNIFIWSMTNLGLVDITGLDFTAESELKISQQTRLIFSGSHTYQRALDVTSPLNGAYGHQIPYTPRVSGSGRVALETNHITVAYSVLWSGKRFAGYQNFIENKLPGYADHQLTLLGNMVLGKTQIKAKVEILNVLNERYAIVKWFPMPGRSFRASLQLDL